MAEKKVRAVVAGANSVLGKELADFVADSNRALWDLSLADTASVGDVTAAGDEALVVGALNESTFAGADVVFFAGDQNSTVTHWKQAVLAGAAVVDMTNAIPEAPGVVWLAPGLAEHHADLHTVAAISAHPAAVLLGTLVRRVIAVEPSATFAVTLIEPASQRGKLSMDELHRQTVALLSFQSVPTEVHDAQLAFAVRDELGSEAQVQAGGSRQQISAELQRLGADTRKVALQVLHGGVFHGYTASVWVQAERDMDVPALRAALADLSVPDDQDVSNLAVAGESSIRVRVHSSEENARGVWLWAAADNLQLAAANAEACALELLALRPSTPMQ